MSKQCKIVDPELPSTSSISADFDWNECIFCQEQTKENLQCPANSKRSDVDVGTGYKTLETILERCQLIEWFPIPIRLEHFIDENGLALNLQLHNAKWHKTCRNKFSELKNDRHEKQKRKGESGEQVGTKSKITRQSVGSATMTMTEDCFFCGESSGDLHKASTFEIDKHVRKCALDLQDTVLLAKLSAGDMISQEAIYHVKCLTHLYNRARPLKISDESSDSRIHGIVLAELVVYTEESRIDSDVIPIFKLADLTRMYTSRMEQFGLETSARVHSTDLKKRILSAIPALQAHKQGRDVLLLYNDDVGAAIKQATRTSYDDEAILLSKAAQIVRKDMMAMQYIFNGTFETGCQQNSVPQSLKTLVGMILGGPNIKMQSSNSIEAQTTLTISQLLQFNSSIRRRKDSSAVFHSTEREPPLPIYLCLLLHAETRKRGLIDKMYSLGLSLSYDRIMNVSTALGNSICEAFNIENVVCPAKLRNGVFTTAAVDNIDHNPSSTTAQGSLHGTAISLFQHPVTGNVGVERLTIPIDSTVSKREDLKPLPKAYTIVPPVVLPKEPAEIPTVHGPMISDGTEIASAMNLEYRWLNHVNTKIEADDIEDMEYSWAAFHASQATSDINAPLDISSLLPMFQEEAKSIAMIRHSMNIAKQCVQFLNPGQIPVITCDQPLYALAKSVQWNWPNRFSEEQIVVLFGGLHIKIAALRTIGDWLDNSGWTSALSQANIASSGTADSFLRASHVSRTRHAHEVTASALYILMQRAYRVCMEEPSLEDTDVTFEEWRELREIESPLFHFWSLTLRFELYILLFVRSLREGNFKLYKDSMTQIIPWFFALDHPNYARWLPVHVRDMMALNDTAPSVATEFENGKFVLHKSHSKFSSIAIDQAHEQNNKLVKGEGGAIGLTENMTQLQRWMVSGPEMARLINEFQTSQEWIKRDQSKGPDVRHHEQTKSKQTTFSIQVKALCAVFEEMGNPFQEQSTDLLILDTRDIVDPRVCETIRNVENLGKEQYHQFVTERLQNKSKSLHVPIKQNKLLPFSRQQPKTETKDKQQITSLKQNCSLFSQLYVSCQVRNGDLEEFFRHENQSYPPALSQFGEMRLGSKSDLLVPLERLTELHEEAPNVDVLVIDGAAIINMLKPRGSKTFEDYFNDIFMPYIHDQLRFVSRLDVVWDEYISNSLKASTRCKRGKGVRRRVLPDSRVPGNWEAFLRVNDNKTELFIYLAEQLVVSARGSDEQKQVITTKGTVVLCSLPKDISKLSPCTHEEADTRMMLHVYDAVEEGLKRVILRTVDTDVVVIAISIVHEIEVNEFWIAFGVGKNFRYLAVHDIAKSLGPLSSRGLLFFHSFTGCDQVSSFAYKGKKTAWDTSNSFEEITPVFETLSRTASPNVISNFMLQIERYVILMYDKTSQCTKVNDTRKDLFTRKGRAIDNIPPSESALLEHTKRAVYMASLCWGKCLEPSPQVGSPSEWGWQKDKTQMWIPYWTSLQQASACCKELIKCGCKIENGCRGRCKCVKAMLLCTALCKCGGECDRD